MIKTSIANEIGATIQKTTQKALQADGITQLAVVGEVHLTLSRNHLNLQLDALVVDSLDVDILAGTPFMITNDISLRPSKQEVTIQGCENVYYGSRQPAGTIGSVRRTQTTVLRAPSSSTVIWPGQYLELDLPDHVDPDSILALEPRKDCSRSDCEWPSPHIVQAVARKIRIPNQTPHPKRIPRHDHLCQVLPTYIPYPHPDVPKSSNSTLVAPSSPTPHEHSLSVQLDPDSILTKSMHSEFSRLVKEYDDVFDRNISGYNGAAGPFEAVVNMGPVQPPQRKGRLPQYAPTRIRPY